MAANEDEVIYRRAVRLLSFGFFGVFSGFQAAQGLQTSLNADLGDINLACIYITFTVLCLVAPLLLNRIERSLGGMRRLLVICAAAYSAMALSNVLPVSAEPSFMWAVPIVCDILVGIAAPLLWTAQNTYVSRCASRAAALQAENAEDLPHWRSVMTTRYNSLFFGFYQFAGTSGNVVASAILLLLARDEKGSEKAKPAIFATAGCASLLGAFVFLAMPEVHDDAALEDKPPSALQTGRLAIQDAKVRLMIPLMLTNGMLLAFFLGDFQADVTCPAAGPGFAGFAIALFFGVNSLVSLFWGHLISSGVILRRSVYVISSLLLAVFLLIFLLWEVPQNYVLPPGSTAWKRTSMPTAAEISIVFVSAIVFAGGDSFYEAGPPMTLQTFYSGSDKVSAAMANYKLWQSLGYAIQFGISIPLKAYPHVRASILLILLCISLTCVLVLDRCIARVDGQGAPALAHADDRGLISG
mmetsp:Transcript_87307/g.154743  ORF Transcript_87307/g.154743 Transcript_87307/m.154743 type:complete len:469 (-) Transcript_87307:48-1454(-)|eukprot:CAMPEP_0197631666 /NCGR_PEP_ID=MMETSP1338-20131121/8759_1 /TAXON_ID=43686 ORGANISM="Pelagodinium beii, Strain RCC1491" /NCGR_SAMPLE_ID=MMETSP1338 /ASSEMBLY_ACC=CAM_ASM_000754 /LENGTH=468 /DNA_ID=CAMNT_0043203177 /DNA_START=110 /DNA_END=1516 /DNA_ORIENTATION=+